MAETENLLTGWETLDELPEMDRKKSNREPSETIKLLDMFIESNKKYMRKKFDQKELKRTVNRIYGTLRTHPEYKEKVQASRRGDFLILTRKDA